MSTINESEILSYVSCACNRSPLCADWNSKNLICFGASNGIVLFDTEFDGSAKITKTCVKHTGRVNAVRWIKSAKEKTDNDIISGSADKTAIIWIYVDGVYSPKYTLAGHKNSITVVDATYLWQNGQSVLYAVTASVDSSIKIWKKNCNDEFECKQTIDLGNGLCLALQIFSLANVDTPLLACGLDDCKIHLFAEKDDVFKRVHVLVGHEDWIRGLDCIQTDSKLMIASCSQDTYIRLWSIEPYIENKTIDDEIQIKKQVFELGGIHWAISLDAVLSGHEGWVYGVHWNYDPNCSGSKLKLLSSSIDKSLIIWEPDIVDGKEGVWSEVVRVGEVGGSGLGFYGGKFSHDGKAIMAHGYTGSFHIWKCSQSENNESWNPSVVCGGHFGEVVDLGWEPDGDFLISISADQTTRVHAPWKRKDSSKMTWHEIARPQIHGFDMSCLAVITKYTFATGAEEKVIRAFQAPRNFINNFHNICNSNSNDLSISVVSTDFCEGASVPSLGLSNKAVYVNDENIIEPNEKHVKDQYADNYFVPVNLQEPPTEETLMQNTLWPEIHKLYGHGYEVFALAASKDGELLASACKATTAQHAAILIWNTSTWTQIQSLISHQLTVTQLAFSPDNTKLLSVSRDRRWSLFQRNVADGQFSLIGTTDKSNGIHTRIIWCCAWSHDSQYFYTGSRDGKIIMWGNSNNISTESSTGNYSSIVTPLEIKSQSITALAAAAVTLNEDNIIAAGFESGIIVLYRVKIVQDEWQSILKLDNNFAHHLTVKRLSFRPRRHLEDNPNLLQLASCSDDHMVKIYTIDINPLE